MSIATNEPSEIIAGDTTQWKKKDSDYSPDDDWVLKYAFIKDTQRHVVTAATDPDDEDGFLVTISANASKAWAPGRYAWTAYVESGSERHTLGRGGIEVLENYALAPAKSHAQKVLENLRAVIEGRTMLNQDIESSSINGQSISRMPSSELLRWLQYYEGRVQQEDARRGSGSGRVLQTF